MSTPSPHLLQPLRVAGSMARPLLADPDFTRKTREGRIGGFDVASELDAQRAIDQARRLAVAI